MKLTDLSPAAGAKKTRKRVGRGIGSGLGKTSGKGSKGQKARSGYKHRAWFEGGQMPLQRRLPKRGFHNIFAKQQVIINVDRLNQFEDGSEVTPQALREKGLIRAKDLPVKLLGEGTLEKKLSVKLHAASAKAVEKVKAAGGTFQTIPGAAPSGS